MEVIKEQPSHSSFLALSEHQSQTPGSFFGGKAVLHLHSPGALLVIADDALHANDAFANLRDQSSSTTNGGANGVAVSSDSVVVSNVDVWVTSEYVACSLIGGLH